MAEQRKIVLPGEGNGQAVYYLSNGYSTNQRQTETPPRNRRSNPHHHHTRISAYDQEPKRRSGWWALEDEDADHSRVLSVATWNRIMAIVFCVIELILTGALLAFGGARLSVISPNITTLNPQFWSGMGAFAIRQQLNTSLASLMVGCFGIGSSIIGIGAFLVRRKGLKVAHVALSLITILVILSAVVVTQSEIATNYNNFTGKYFYGARLSDKDLALNVSLLSLAASAAIILFITTIVQSIYGLIPANQRLHSWPIFHLTTALLVALFSTVSLSLGCVAIHQVLTYDVANIQTLRIYLLKREIGAAATVSTFYVFLISVFSVVGSLARSRPISLSSALLFVPGILYVMQVLGGFPELVAGLYFYSGSDYIGVYYALMGFLIADAVALFIAIPATAVTVFRK